MPLEKKKEESLGVTDYLYRKLHWYGDRYIMMAAAITINVIVLIMVLSLFTGLQMQVGGDIPSTIEFGIPSHVREELSQEEAASISFWLLLASVLLFASSVGAIYNTIRSSVWYARKEIGILKSLGLSDREISSLVIYEALLIAWIGWIAGFFLGMLLSNQFLFQMFQAGGDAMFFAPAKSLPVVIIASLVLTLLVSGIASHGPASEASRLEPVEAMASR